jgi:hypothetical protein
MKKFISVICIILITLFSPSYSQSLSDMQYEFDQAVGISASDSMATGIGVSMMGWGLAIIIGISILAIVLHQSAATTHASSSQGGSGSPSAPTAGNSGVGSVL